MPSYTVEPEKDTNYPEVAASPSGKKEKRYPTVTICCDQAIIDALELNKDAEITLRGKIVGLSSSQGNNSYDNRTELRIELREVEAEPDDGEAEPDEPEESMQDAIDKGLGYKKRSEK